MTERWGSGENRQLEEKERKKRQKAGENENSCFMAGSMKGTMVRFLSVSYFSLQAVDRAIRSESNHRALQTGREKDHNLINGQDQQTSFSCFVEFKRVFH